jgi:Fe-S-cluster containining protein
MIPRSSQDSISPAKEEDQIMAELRSIERLDVSLNTPAGQITVPVDIPTSFILVTEIVPVMRRLGEQAQSLEERRSIEAGETISCRKGCAACCRMLVPVSSPEAFALQHAVEAWPEERRRGLLPRLAEARRRLEQAGLLTSLTEIAETARQLTDDQVEATNRAYYALRMPCPFLVDEVCSIYEDRPAACRELLVTSPAELCQDLVRNPVKALPVPIRIGTIMGSLWAELTGGPTRLIPLPLALDWADRHAAENRRSWQARELLDKALTKIWRYLSLEFTHRRPPNS